MTRPARDDGFSLVELLIVVAIVSIIAAVAVPGLIRARITANEGAALSSLRAIHSGQVVYAATCGNGGYAANLNALMRPPPGGAPFISPFATRRGVKSGYRFGIRGDRGRLARPRNTCNRRRSMGGFIGYAIPTTPRVTGIRRFGVSEGGTLRFDNRRNLTNRARYNRAQVLLN